MVETNAMIGCGSVLVSEKAPLETKSSLSGSSSQIKSGDTAVWARSRYYYVPDLLNNYGP
ncbi:uncharacterized protein RAG0_06302 [Rhynchosporium agropyri]|uniref:Uncharacterized protein n=2 Tax=Rhynchosporium TaxID=38037 RepID=A0A1E1MPS7_RHYSE|nr:uncharacterized protein RAG0_06302 [Rhynchosporium agropyri]CZT51104.1 uncharacterized protein RSE6_12191 [Rhynchosporium secalis]